MSAAPTTGAAFYEQALIDPVSRISLHDSMTPLQRSNNTQLRSRPPPPSRSLLREKSHSFDENTLSRDEYDRLQSLLGRHVAVPVRTPAPVSVARHMVPTPPRVDVRHAQSPNRVQASFKSPRSNALKGSLAPLAPESRTRASVSPRPRVGITSAPSSDHAPKTVDARSRSPAAPPPVPHSSVLRSRSPAAHAPSADPVAHSQKARTHLSPAAAPSSSMLSVPADHHEHAEEYSSAPASTGSSHSPLVQHSTPSTAPPAQSLSNFSVPDSIPLPPTVSPYAMLQVSELINTDMPADRVLQRLVDATQHLVPCERVSFFRLDHAAETSQNDHSDSCLVCVVTASSRPPSAAYLTRDARSATLPSLLNASPVQIASMNQKLAIASLAGSSLQDAYSEAAAEIGIPLEPADRKPKITTSSTSAPVAQSTTGFRGLRVSVLRGMAGYVVKTGRPIRVNRDLRTDWRFDEVCDSRPDMVVQTVMAVPVRGPNGQYIGVLEALNSRSPLPCGNGQTGFSEEDETLFRSMATNVCTVLGKAELEFEVRKRRKQAVALVQLSEITSTEFGVKKAMQRILRAASSVVEAEKIDLFLVDEEGKNIKLLDYDTEKLVLNPGIAAQVPLTGRAVMISNTSNDWRIDVATDSDAKFHSILVVPIKDLEGRCCAVIRAVNKRGSPLSPSAPPDGFNAFVNPSYSSNQLLVPETTSQMLWNGTFNQEDQDLLTAVATTAGGTLSVAKLYDEAVNRRAQTEALLRVSELMSAEIGTEKVVPRIIEASYQLVHAERITLFLVIDTNRSGAVDRTTDDLAPNLRRTSTLTIGGKEGVSSPTSTSGPLPFRKELVCVVTKDEDFKGARIPWGSGIVGHVAMTGKSLNIHDAYADPRFDSTSDRVTGFVTKCILTVPIHDRDNSVVAVIQAINCMPSAIGKRTPASFSAESQSLLESMAVSAGILLRKSQLLSAAVMAQRKSNALMKLVKLEANTAATMEEAIDGIVQIAYSVLDADRISVFFVDQSRGELFSIVSRDASQLSFPIGKGISGHVAKTGKALNIADAYQNSKFDPSFDIHTGYRTRSILCMPIKHAADGTIIGVISAINKRGSSGISAGVQKQMVTAATAHRLTRNQTLNISRTQSVSVSRATSFGVGQVQPPSPNLAPQKGVSFAPANHKDFLDISLKPDADVISEDGDDDEEHEVFSDEDVEILEAFCVEASSIIHRFLSDAIVNQVDVSERASVVSLLDAYSNHSTKSSSRLIGIDETTEHMPVVSSGISRLVRSGTIMSRPTALEAVSGKDGTHQFFGVVTIRDPSFNWPMQPPRVQPATLNSTNFNVWEYTADELMIFSYQMFADLGLIDAFKIAPEKLQRFFMTVRSNYRDNPFHNWYHGFSVMHFAYFMLRQTNMYEQLTRIDVFGSLVGAIAHDIDHPGRTNVFETNTKTDRAFVHNDNAVLENHHAMTLMCLLRLPDCNIISELGGSDVAAFRKVVLHGIRSTDMALHFEKCKELDTRDGSKPFDCSKELDRMMVVSTIVHAADLGAQTLPTGIAKQWEERISQEFDSQAREEESLGLPVLPFMQNLSNGLHRSKLQVNFIQFVLEPWWKQVVRVMPQLKSCWDGLLANKAFFEQLARHPSDEASSQPTSSRVNL